MIFSGRNVEEAAVERRIALEVGATARFGGEGGDQVFFQGPAPPTVSDCLADRGMSPGLFRLAWNVARREQLSIWEILKQALASGLNPSPWRPYPQALFAAEFVSAGVLDTLSHTDWLDRRFVHPWFLSPRDLPPGKLWHILWLSWSPKLYTAMEQAGDPERVEPLTSQPLLELCLRIPTFLLSSGAEDRSLARNAFFRDLPPGIRTRRSKGSIERFIRQTLLNNLAFVREALVDGVLAKAGLLDCARLASALSGTPERVASAPVYLFDLLAMEIWARSVSDLLGPAKS
jgi:asparagine synthase (glutamine-hydrolysing)